MGDLIDKAKKLATAGGTAAAAYGILVRVEGHPLRERDKPAKVKVAGIPFFERTETGDRYVLRFIPIGKRRK